MFGSCQLLVCALACGLASGCEGDAGSFDAGRETGGGGGDAGGASATLGGAAADGGTRRSLPVCERHGPVFVSVCLDAGDRTFTYSVIQALEDGVAMRVLPETPTKFCGKLFGGELDHELWALEDAEGWRWVLGLAVPGLSHALLAAGDEVRVTRTITNSTFNLGYLKVERGGDLVATVGTNPFPGIDVEVADPECWERNGSQGDASSPVACDVIQAALRVTVDGESAVVGLGDTVRVGELVVVNGLSRQIQEPCGAIDDSGLEYVVGAYRAE